MPNTAAEARGDPGTAGPAPVQVQTRYERFPASIKGAFVLRGADGNPHSVQFRWAGVHRVPDGGTTSLPVDDRLLDVAPARDLFVPFEAPVADLEPGWYAVHSGIQVDGSKTWQNRGRPFVIPWPRNDIRRGSIPVRRDLQVGRVSGRVDRVDLLPDAAVVSWRVLEGGDEEVTPQDVQARLLADGVPLDALPGDARVRLSEYADHGQLRTTSYPVAMGIRTLAVVLSDPSGDSSEPVELPLR